jgi:hypothetical protein
MKIVSPILFGMSLVFAGGSFAAAQDAMSSPPKIIQIMREYLKPGKSGMVHDRSEAAFVTAANHAKLQGHYVALNSMSGKSRALYILRYDSLAAWEKDNKMVDTPAMSAEFDRALMADGELLESTDSGVFAYNEELSYHPRPDLSHARYYEISVFHVRPGHRKEWYEVTKMYKDACEKAQNGDHWGMYEVMYGADGGTFISLTHRDSLSEIDTTIAGQKKFMDAIGGEEGMAKLDDLFGQAVDSSRSELFSINPRQSYADEAWVKADPTFWKPKMTKSAPESAATKPVAPKSAAQPPAASKPGTR